MPRLVPTAVKKLKGTLQPCRTNFNEPVPTDPLPLDAPKYFTRDEKVCWRELHRFTAPGVLTVSDQWAAEDICMLMAKRRRRETLSPSERTALNHLYVRFGLTPVDRAKVQAIAPKTEEEEDYSAFVQ